MRLAGFRQTASLLFFLILPFLLSAETSRAYVIDGTGGDCSEFGTWNRRTKTCTMARDVSAEESQEPYHFQADGYPVWAAVIKIAAGGVTLDGNGHTLYKPQPPLYPKPNVGIRIYKKSRVTIRNLTVKGFMTDWGISADATSSLAVRNCTFQECYAGISMNSARSPVFVGNTFGTYPYTTDFRATYAMQLYYVDGARVHDNLFDRYGSECYIQDFDGGAFRRNSFRGKGIWCQDSCDDNIVEANAFVSSGVGYPGGGVGMHDSRGNIVRDNTFDHSGMAFGGDGQNIAFHNNFFSYDYDCGSPSQPHECVLEPNVGFSTFEPSILSYALPVGGNYYNFYDEPAEGCEDANADGVCDAPLTFGGGPYGPGLNYAISVDYFPFTRPDGWLP